MKNRYPLIFLFVFSFFSCEEREASPSGLYENGVFIVNEGNFTDTDGSISFYDEVEKTVTHKIFESANNRPLAGLIQSMAFFHGYYYLVDQLGRVEVVEENNFMSSATLSETLVLPRYFIGINTITLGVISDWGPYDEFYQNPHSKIYIVGLNPLYIIKEIESPSRPEEMYLYQSKLFVPCASTDQVSIYDTEDFNLKNIITVGPGPVKLVSDHQEHLWVVCTGNFTASSSLVQIDPDGESVIKSIQAPSGVIFNGRMAIHPGRRSLYIMSEQWAPDYTYTETVVYEQNVDAAVFESNARISGKNYYGLGVDPETGFLWVSDAAAFQSNGRVYLFDPEGTPIDTLEAGRGPRDFLFN